MSEDIRKMIDKVKNFNENTNSFTNNVIENFLDNPHKNMEKKSMGGQSIYNGILYSDNVRNNNVYTDPIAKFHGNNSILINNDNTVTKCCLDYLIREIEKRGYKYEYVDSAVIAN
jgi:hypothetical protein